MIYKTPFASDNSVIIWQNPIKETLQCDISTSDCLTHLTPFLQAQGYCVKSLSTEDDILQAVLERTPSLLLIYLQTAEEAGYNLCRVLRTLTRSRTMPIVFVGVRDATQELVKALRCGGDEYIQLPARCEEVRLRLERHLHTANMMRSLEEEKASLHQKLWSYSAILKQQEEIQVSLTRKNQALQRLAFTDGLTQVANRRSFNETLPQLWQAAYETHQPLSLLLCDIDYFKRYNDTYGHPTGDDCLKSVADALVKAAHRKDDQVSRYGGEEFAILLPSTDAKGAQQVALAAHLEIAKAQIAHEASLVKPIVSLSIGICTLTPDSAQQRPDLLIHGADEALYKAKLEGRDCSIANTARGFIPLDSVSQDEAEQAGQNRLVKVVVNAATHAAAS